MSYLAYPISSPYNYTPQNSWCIGNLVFRPIPADSEDSQFFLQQRHEYRPDRLAYDLYNTATYWWVFCVRNAFLRRDPIWSFTNGLTIIVPSAAYLHRILGA